MFRTDRDALAGEVEELRAERDALIAENERLRAGVLARRAPPPAYRPNVYKNGPSVLGDDERIALARVDLEPMPVGQAVVFHFLTFGLFSLIRYNLLHSKLPQIEKDDPTPGKAIGFSFIPYFNFYWVIWNTLRLTDRVNLQFALRGHPDAVPRRLMLACGIVSVIPYFNILIGWLFLWPFAVYYLERAMNRLAEIDREKPWVEEMAATWQAPPAAAALGAGAEPGLRFDAPDDLAELEVEAEREAERAWVKKA